MSLVHLQMPTTMSIAHLPALVVVLQGARDGDALRRVAVPIYPEMSAMDALSAAERAIQEALNELREAKVAE